MAILDFLKTLAGAPEKPDYEITDVDFGEGYENVKPKKFGTEVSQYAAYVYSRLHVKVNRPFETVWRVKIFAPGGKLIQGRNEPEGYAGSFRCRFPETGTFFMNLAVGNRLNEFFTGLGAYGWSLCEENGNPIISKFFYTVSLDAQQRRKGYMSIISVEFACSFSDGNKMDFKDPSGCGFMTDVKYLKSRVKYAGISFEPHTVRLDVEVVRPGGAVSKFDHEVTINNHGGTFTLPGWGNDGATFYYNPGTYVYRILYEGNLLYSRNLEFKRSIRDSGNVAVRSLTLHKESQLKGCTSGIDSMNGLPQPNLYVTDDDFLFPVVCFTNFSPDDVEFLLKITGPDDNLMTFAEPSVPAGYSMRHVFKKREFYIEDVGINGIAFFKGFKKTCNGRFVKGEYFMSLYIRNWRGDMVCLKVSRVRVDWL